jgi:hypothetical protein
VKNLMTCSLFLSLSLVLLGCSSNPNHNKRKMSSIDYGDDLDCGLVSKGCLLKRNSSRLIIFFRGWVSPNMASRYGGSRKQVASKDWANAAEDLIFEDLKLNDIELESSLYVLGSAHLSLSQDELLVLMEESGATEIVFAAHSGGYKGMAATIRPMPLEFWNNVSGIWMLDNFYGGGSFARDLERNFGVSFLQQNCFGFLTEHNRQSYQASYSRFCPQVLGHGVSHSGGVLQCMPYFEKGEVCRP